MAFSEFSYPKDFEDNNPISLAVSDGTEEGGKNYLKYAFECSFGLCQTLDNMFRPLPITIQSFNIIRPKNTLDKRTQPPNNNNHLCMYCQCV